MRLVALWKSSPRKMLAALGALMVATAVAVGSGANFNSSSANTSNIITAGNIAQSNSKANQAILTASGMKPGGVSTGTVDLKNTGDLDAAFTLTKSNLTDTPASPALSAKLDLKVQDLGDPAATPVPTPVTKYDGKLGAMGSISLGTYAVNETHRYKFTVTFPDGGTGGADNAYKSAETQVDFNWTSAQV